MLVISNFSFAHNFFQPFWKKKAFGKHRVGFGEEKRNASNQQFLICPQFFSTILEEKGL